MNFSKIKKVYFLGIGGIGMSAIARFFNSQNIQVYGYDKTSTILTKELEAEGINIIYDDSVKALQKQIIDTKFPKSSTLVVLTPAIPKNHEGWNWFIDNNFTIYKRAKVLGVISENFYTIAVAGTHGKTTTSTLIAHILKHSGVDIIAFLGGVSSNYQTNYIAPVGEYPFMVVEADEFDRSFLSLKPNDAIITSTDADHLDIYGKHDELQKSFIEFSKCLKPKGTLILKKDIDIVKQFSKKHISYSIHKKADFEAQNIQVKNGSYYFDLKAGGHIWESIKMGLPGSHNVENAVAAIVVSLNLGLNEVQIRKGLSSFKGVKRRFEYIVKKKDFVYIDDYAHHPEELKAAISSTKTLYPKKKITGIFQPHLYTRTRDFASGFAQSLDMLDEVILLDIYPARELPIKDVNSEMILHLMKNKNVVICNKDKVLKLLKNKKIEVLLTLGAGDIDQLVKPIEKLYI